MVVQAGSGFNVDTGAALCSTVAAEVAEVAAEVLVIRLDRGVRNLIHCCVVVQAGSGFDVNTSAALCLIVAAKVAAEVLTEVAGGLGYRS